MIYGRRPVLTRTSLTHKQFKARARTSYHDTLAILAEVGVGVGWGGGSGKGLAVHQTALKDTLFLTGEKKI